jgi:RimJ/RimL family protein N-acetyltransferase
VNPPERIETQRLVLRKPRLADAQCMFAAYAADPQVTRYLTWRPHQSPQETRGILERMLGMWKSGTAYSWAITLNGSDDIVGMIALHVEEHGVAVGYVLAQALWGRGYMTEAAQAVIHWALGQPGIVRVYATTDVDNSASRRVLEKAGMQCEGRLRKYILHPNLDSQPRDSFIYSIVK